MFLLPLKAPGKNVVVSCVSFETVKVVEPIRYITREFGGVQKEYILHYDRYPKADKNNI